MSLPSAGRSPRPSPPPMCCCSPAAPCFAAATPTTAWPSPAPSPPRSSRWSRPHSPRIRHGSSPKAASPPTMSRSVASASGAPRSSANCSLAWCRSSAPSRRHPKPSVSRPSCSPATSVTTTPSPRSSTSSPDADELPPTRSIHHSQKETADMTNVGWIGLGAMGSPMASFVAKAGHAGTAFDIDPQKAVALAGDGVKPAATISDAAADADVLVLMVATAEQAESVLYGDGKAAAALKPGSVVLLMATVGPAAVEDWAQRLAVTDVQVVDAPVSGGAARAGQGDLLIMVSGSESALATVQPMLDVMARNAPVVGTAPGEGKKGKLVNQLLCGVHVAVAAEALAYAEALGLDAGDTWEVLRPGAAASFMLDDSGARMIDNPNNDIRSATDIFVKDMGLVTETARAKAYPTPLASAAEQLFLAGRRAGLGRADGSSLIQIVRGTATGSA